MKHYHAALTAALAVCALVLAVFLLNPTSEPGSSANRTAYSFIYALNHQNQGRACSWVSSDLRIGNCDIGTYRIVARRDNPDGSVRYTVTSPDAWRDSYVTVVQHANGKWRVDRID